MLNKSRNCQVKINTNRSKGNGLSSGRSKRSNRSNRSNKSNKRSNSTISSLVNLRKNNRSILSKNNIVRNNVLYKNGKFIRKSCVSALNYNTKNVENSSGFSGLMLKVREHERKKKKIFRNKSTENVGGSWYKISDCEKYSLDDLRDEFRNYGNKNKLVKVYLPLIVV